MDNQTEAWTTLLPEVPVNETGMPSINGRESQCHIYDFTIEAVCMGLLCIFGFTGNTLSMLCLWKDKSKTATPFLLISLELADTLFLVTVLLLRVMTKTAVYTGWANEANEVFLVFLAYLGAYVYPIALLAETGTIWITVLVTVNRYVSVCRPYEVSSWCSVQQAKRQVVAIWILALLFNLPRFFEHRVGFAPEANITTALLSPLGHDKVYQIVYGNVLYFIVLFLVPLITLIILNWKLIKGLRKTKKKRAQLLNNSDPSHSKSEDDITLMLIVVVLVFVVSQAPALLTQVLRAFLSPELKTCPHFYFYQERLSDLMVVMNSSMNFIIYCFCSRKFRKILFSILCSHRGNGTDSPEHSRHVARATKATCTTVNHMQNSAV